MKHAHLVGIGGSGLSAIASVLLDNGWNVSGCDTSVSASAHALAQRGVRIYQAHSPGHVEGVDVVLISSAIASDNPEIASARARGIPVQKRAEFLGGYLAGRQVVAVAGTHGKTTTTGLIAFMLDRAGLDPSFIVGGVLADYGANARSGASAIFVIEADEYDGMFLGLSPSVAVVTSVEHDHPDCFPTPEAMQEAYRQFSQRVAPGGHLIVCADDPRAMDIGEVASRSGTRVSYYGLNRQAEWKADAIQSNSAGGSDFLVVRGRQTLGLARSRLPGLHNVANSLAAFAVADHFQVGFNAARGALAEFRGVGRRFEFKGEARGVIVVDDYAHHPTEIRATLAAARRRYPGRAIWAMFQPHTFSRTRALLADFAASFRDADHVVVTEIFRAREKDDPTLSGRDILARMDHSDARYISRLDEAADDLAARLESGDVLITLSAGDGHTVGEKVLEKLGSKR